MFVDAKLDIIHQKLLHRKNLNNYDKTQLYKNISLDYLELNNIDKSIEYSTDILNIDNSDEWIINHIIELYKLKQDWRNATEYLKILFNLKDNNLLICSST